MKQLILLIAGIVSVCAESNAQDNTYPKQMEANVSKLENAKAVGDYQILQISFIKLADSKKTDWLPYYYAALCNAKISWLYKDNGSKIAPFANLATQQLKKAESFLDTSKNKFEISEVDCVWSMIYRAKIFISPMFNGMRYGPTANQYIDKAKQMNPENPRVSLLEGWMKYYAPSLWGGDKTKAKQLLELALKQLENRPSPAIYPHWGKTECENILKLYK
jgi:hypothetical protein